MYTLADTQFVREYCVVNSNRRLRFGFHKICIEPYAPSPNAKRAVAAPSSPSRVAARAGRRSGTGPATTVPRARRTLPPLLTAPLHSNRSLSLGCVSPKQDTLPVNRGLRSSGGRTHFLSRLTPTPNPRHARARRARRRGSRRGCGGAAAVAFVAAGRPRRRQRHSPCRSPRRPPRSHQASALRPRGSCAACSPQRPRERPTETARRGGGARAASTPERGRAPCSREMPAPNATRTAPTAAAAWASAAAATPRAARGAARRRAQAACRPHGAPPPPSPQRSPQ